MTRATPWRRMSVAAACAFLALAPAGRLLAQDLPVAFTQPAKKFGPDLLQTMGVGSRSVGMGSAFTAIADDVSATFWNPAKLGLLTVPAFEAEMRSVSRNKVFAVNTAASLSVSMKPPQLSFAGVTYPVKNLGTFGLSYALGGYADLALHSDMTDQPTGVRTVTDLQYLVRNSFVTLGFGRQEMLMRGRLTLGWGLSLFTTNQDQSVASTTTTTEGENVSTSAYQGRTNGRGTGVLVGVAVRPRYPIRGTEEMEDGQWSAGLTYRLGPKLHRLNDQGDIFNNELPDRLTFGVAYEGYSVAVKDDKRDKKDKFVGSAEIQYYSSANGPDRLDSRRAVTNWHLGVEYVPGFFNTTMRYRMPLRLGFRTVANANDRLFESDNAVTFGMSYQAKRPGYQDTLYAADWAMEYLTSSGLLQYTISGRLFF